MQIFLRSLTKECWKEKSIRFWFNDRYSIETNHGKKSGTKKTSLRELPKISDRVSFILRRTWASLLDSTITVAILNGTVKNTCCYGGVLLLGPGMILAIVL